MTSQERARIGRELCGKPYVISSDEEAGEADTVYCGLHGGHAGFHVAMVWWFEDDAQSSTQ